MAMLSVPVTLASLPAHAIFEHAEQKTGEEWELVDSPNDDLVGTKSSRMIMRDKELIVASGSDVRMCSLGVESWGFDNGSVGSYKTLKSECLNFAIHSLVLNPTGRLLAVVGLKQVAIVVLPSLGSGQDTSGEIECRGFAIDEFEYSTKSTSVISKVAWHPLGEAGESVWILTSDGRLQEYDVRRPDDPTQTFTFLPQTSAASSSKFTAIDPLSRHATSFAFSPLSTSTYDFSPLVVHVLVANGDMYAMGPILPLRSELPIRHIQGLKAYVKERRRRAEGRKDEDELDRLESWDTFVDDLVKQATSKRDEETTRRSSSVVSISKDIETVRIHPPHLTPTGGPASGPHKSLLRQGPVIYTPGPQEVDDDVDENVASDLVILSMPRDEGMDFEEDERSAGTIVSAIGIAWSSGRVDIGMIVDAPEPAWVEKDARYEATPTIPILESVYLESPRSTDENCEPAPVCSIDTLYPDTFYVHGPGGVVRINVRPIIDGALHGETDRVESDVTALVSTDGSSGQAIIGSVSFCNIALGYGILALTSDNQLASTELDFRSVDRLSSSLLGSKTLDTPADPTTDSRSLLSKPLDITALITSITSPSDYDPRALVRARPDSRKPLTDVNALQLKLLGDITSQIRRRTEAIRAASQTIENRLDLQVKEYQRQLKLLKSARSEMKGVTEKEDTSDRIERITKTQRSLADRLDKVVSMAMANHTGPEMSESERKYVKELEESRTHISNLVKKFEKVRQDVQRTKSELSQPDSTNRKTVSSKKEDPGDVKKLQSQVDAESDEIRKMLRKMDRLSVRVEAAMIEGEDSD